MNRIPDLFDFDSSSPEMDGLELATSVERVHKTTKTGVLRKIIADWPKMTESQVLLNFRNYKI